MSHYIYVYNISICVHIQTICAYNIHIYMSEYMNNIYIDAHAFFIYLSIYT